MKDYPIFTIRINATNAGKLSQFSNKWYKVFSQRKKDAIRRYAIIDISKGRKFSSFFV